MSIRSLNKKIMDTTIGAAANAIVDVQSMHGVTFEVDATVNSTAKTAVAGIQAVGTLGGVTYTAVKLTTGLDAAGNLISVAYTTGGTAGSEVVTVVGSAISVQIADGVSTITQVRTAVNASGAAAALVTATGTSATVVAVVAATLIPAMASPTTGVNSKFSVANDTVSITAHGYFTGQVIQVTKSGAAFPGGISGTTDYFVLAIDPNTIALYTSLANALAGTQANGIPAGTGLVDITSDGTAASTMTFTPTAISGVSYKLQKSNSYDPISGNGNWIDCVAGETNSVVTNTITVTANTSAGVTQMYNAYVRVLFAISAGTVQVKVYASAKSV